MITDQKSRDDLKGHLEQHLGRAATPAEVINAETDSLLMVRLLLKRVEALEAAAGIK